MLSVCEHDRLTQPVIGSPAVELSAISIFHPGAVALLRASLQRKCGGVLGEKLLIDQFLGRITAAHAERNLDSAERQMRGNLVFGRGRTPYIEKEGNGGTAQQDNRDSKCKQGA